MAFLDNSFFEEILAESAGAGRYVNLSKLEGVKRMRLMGEGITGWCAWNTENRPVRWEMKPAELPDNIKPDLNGVLAAKKFMAGVVWDYDEDEFKILELNQISVLKQLAKFQADEDYGDPATYDIKISREDKGGKVAYTLLASPPKAVKADVSKQFETLDCDLCALFEGKDPWAGVSA